MSTTARLIAELDERGHWVCNVLWMLDAYTPDNGPLRVVPGSHRWRRLPQSELPEPRATRPAEQIVTGPAGSVVVMNSHLWHGGLDNRTLGNRTSSTPSTAAATNPSSSIRNNSCARRCRRR